VSDWSWLCAALALLLAVADVFWLTRERPLRLAGLWTPQRPVRELEGSA
jgi:hypothetical protein